MGKLDGKVALVTGGGRGIGRGIACSLADEGAAVEITGRHQSTLDETVRVISTAGGSAVAVCGDIADENHVCDAFETLMQRFGRLDILVNNAAAFDGGPLDELTTEAWDRAIATNLRGPFLCTREAVRIMKPQGGGRIINIGSISARRVRPQSAPYSATKHGIWGLTQVTNLEGREHGITCCCLNPGNVRVERRQDSGALSDDEPMIRVEDIAQVALLMATLPRDTLMLEAIVMPHLQAYIGRG